VKAVDFQRNGRLRDCRFARDAFFDCFIFGLLRQEWRGAKR
jgi:RimJ/RimL family protein N-acetyltransferase